MDKLEKQLSKLTDKERERIKAVLSQLKSGNYKGLDIKKLKGREDIFRARRGDLRIIYALRGKEIYILAVERRSEKTYKI